MSNHREQTVVRKHHFQAGRNFLNKVRTKIEKKIKILFSNNLDLHKHLNRIAKLLHMRCKKF